MDKKINNLLKLCLGIHNKENGKKLYDKYINEINAVTPLEVFKVQNSQLELGLLPGELLSTVDKLINLFYKSLESYSWKRPIENSFLFFLMEENTGLEKVLNNIKVLLIKVDFDNNREEIFNYVKLIELYNEHLLKLENILFPYMEKKDDVFKGLKIMWSLHDRTRKELKELISAFENNDDGVTINIILGSLFFKLFGLIQKQELLLFPLATEYLSENDFESMLIQSFDYEFPYIEKPEKPSKSLVDYNFNNDLSNLIKTETGNLLPSQAIMLINTLPVDVTLVDENNKVVFFSRPKERIFPRSAAVIGLDVRNCHPHESIHIVEEIVESFRKGEKELESFWIQMKGMFILIQYFALRSETGEYKGILEVSQEISKIRSLTGEKRLLD